jgi:hypothetical protein
MRKSRLSEALPDVSLPKSKRKRDSRVRKPLILLASLGLLTGTTKTLLDGRYKVGEAALQSVTDYGDAGVLVQLKGIVFWAPAYLREAIETADKSGLVSYRVDTWRRRQDGLLTGTLGHTP